MDLHVKRKMCACFLIIIKIQSMQIVFSRSYSRQGDGNNKTREREEEERKSSIIIVVFQIIRIHC